MKSVTYDPFDRWNRMDNYIKAFLADHSEIQEETVHRLKHFLFQYLAKFSNIDRQEAALHRLDISPWRSQGRHDYHRDYRNDNPLLKRLEFELGKVLGLNQRQFLLLNDQPLYSDFPLQKIDCWKGQKIVHLNQIEDYFYFIETLACLGYTPSMHHAFHSAIQLGLDMENSSYCLPQKLDWEGSFSSFFQHPIYLFFKQRTAENFSAFCLTVLLEKYLDMGLEEGFEAKGLGLLFRDSCSRILYFLQKASEIQFIKYADLVAFENFLGLIYEEMVFWLLVEEPYQQGQLEEEIKKQIEPPDFLRTLQSGMGAFSELLRILVKQNSVIFYYDDYYRECVAFLRSKSPFEIQYPDYEASLEAHLQKLDGKKIDFLFIAFHNNFLPENKRVQRHDVFKILSKIRPFMSLDFTLVLDNTIGFLRSDEISQVLRSCADLNVIVFWSHQKFDQFGVDKFSGGSFAVYSRNESFLAQFRNQKGWEIDWASRQGLTHFFKCGSSLLEKRKGKIFANYNYVKERINPSIEGLIQKEDQIGFSLDIALQIDKERDLQIAQKFAKRGVPLLGRPSFGFNTISCSHVPMKGLRFSIGIEEPRFLDQFISAFHQIFLVKPITAKRVCKKIDVSLHGS